MAEGLPEGLVSTNEAVTTDLQSFERVEVEDIKKLWQVYSANRNVLAENVGRRLENFFWRIWSNKYLLHRLSGEQVAAQFSSINEGGYIRTTPRSSPRSSRSLGSYYTQASSSATAIPPSYSSSSTPTPTSPVAKLGSGSSRNTSRTVAKSPPSLEQEEDGTATPTPSSPFANIRKSTADPRENLGTFTTQPAPILKKSSSASSSRSTKSATVLSPPPEELFKADTEPAIASAEETLPPTQGALDPGLPPPRRYISTRFSEEVAVSTPKVSSPGPTFTEKSTRNQGEGTHKSGKRNSVFVASTGAGKRRPAVMRQRSSQTSQTKPSPSPPSPGILRRSAESTPLTGQSPSAQSFRKAQAADPYRPKERRRVPDAEEASDDSKSKNNENEEATPLGHASSRSTFDDRNRTQHRSFTNLSTLDRKSSAVTATAASYQASGLLEFCHSSSWSSRRQGTDAFHNEIVPLKAPAPSGPEPMGRKPSAPLPKTKSQLTLLLERSKAGSQEELSRVPAKD
ncbi:MAG: hypothetical protein Q9217_001243 [Psora testacea]